MTRTDRIVLSLLTAYFIIGCISAAWLHNHSVCAVFDSNCNMNIYFAHGIFWPLGYFWDFSLYVTKWP